MKRVQIFSPHPDDVELFLGGTLLKHIEEEDILQIVQITEGEMGTLLKSRQGEQMRKIREAEVKKRMSFIPTVSLKKLYLPDGKVTLEDSNEKLIENCIESWQPDLIYLPEFIIGKTYRKHSDHLITGELVYNAAKKINKSIILRFYHTNNPSIYIDITPYERINRKALFCYKSQGWITADTSFLLYRLYLTRLFRIIIWGFKNYSFLAEAFREENFNAKR